MLKNTGVRQLACAYQLKGKIFIQGYSKTTEGFSMLDGPVFTVGENESLESIGQTVINALNDCKAGIYHETLEEHNPRKDPMILTTGMKTWKALGKASRSLIIEASEGKQIIFTPGRFIGSAGYDFIEDKNVISDLNLEHIGKALLEAFSYSENPYLEN